MRHLNKIVRKGSRKVPPRDNIIKCRDGFTLSVIAGWGTYCRPRPAYCFNKDVPLLERWDKKCGKCQPDGFFEDAVCDYRGPFTHVEVGFPSLRPEPWEDWEPYWDGSMSEPDTGTDGVYAYVPVELVRRLIIRHGGERIHQNQRSKRRRRVVIR